jgi:hypothetical protein
MREVYREEAVFALLKAKGLRVSKQAKASPYCDFFAALPIAPINELAIPSNEPQPLVAPRPATISGTTVASVPNIGD